jgi:hypothetical protein
MPQNGRSLQVRRRGGEVPQGKPSNRGGVINADVALAPNQSKLPSPLAAALFCYSIDSCTGPRVLLPRWMIAVVAWSEVSNGDLGSFRWDAMAIFPRPSNR